MNPVRVLGWGRAHPPEILTNAHLEARLDTDDEWIRTRTGIERRHVGGTTSTLATEAGREALDRWGGDPATVDVVIVATCTPDTIIPAVAATVADELGLSGGAMDLNGACAGFVQALIVANGLLATGSERVLVIGADAMSSVVDPDDRSTAILFGDGAGALLLAADHDRSDRGHGDDAPVGGLLGHHLGSDPSARDILCAPLGGHLTMDGQAVFKLAVRAATESVERALAHADLVTDEIDLFVPHQANERITDAIARRLQWSGDTVVSTIADTGNTSAGTIPASLARAADAGRIHDGAVVVMSGFGAGMTWASAVFRWRT